MCLFCAGFVIALFLLLTFAQMPLYNVPTWEGKQVLVTGRVSDIRNRNEKLQIYLKSVIVSDDEEITELKQNIGAICYVSHAERLPVIGSVIKLSGTFYNMEQVSNEGQFDMARYYQIRGVDFSLTGAKIVEMGKQRITLRHRLYLLQNHFARVFDNYFLPKHSAILKAMVLGDRDSLDTETKELFQKAGISHLLAISGTHVGIIGIALYSLLKRLLRSWKVAAILSAVILVLYCMMTGLGASTLRAMIMFLLNLLADVIGRAYDLFTALSAAGLISLCVNPLLIYDAGFILSFCAVMGVALVLPVISKAASDFCPTYLKGALVSFSITVFTLPFSLYFFYRFPVYSLILNLILIPMAGVLLICAILCALVGGITLIAPVEVILTIPCKLILDLYIWTCQISEKLPGNLYIAGKPEIWRIALYYLLLGVGLFLLKKENRQKLAGIAIVILSVMVLIIRPLYGFECTMLDMGQGLCMTLRTSGHCIVFDGGSLDVSEVGKYRILPFLEAKGIRVVDIILVSHTDEDHISGIRELLEKGKEEGIRIKRLGLSMASWKSEKGAELVRLAEKNGIEVLVVMAGDVIQEGDLKLQCLYPANEKGGDINELSMVMQITYGKFKMLLCGDVEGEGEQKLIKIIENNNLTESVYQVSHHGSKGTNSQELLDRIRPEFAIISAGRNNQYGHPHKETLDRLKNIKSEIFVTREVGMITISTDGEKQRLETYLD